MTIIGIDPHLGSHTAAALDGCVQDLGEGEQAKLLEVEDGCRRSELGTKRSHTVDARMRPTHTTAAHPSSND